MGSSGEVTVAGSTWHNAGDLYVGYVGAGTLNIVDGSAVTAARTTYVAYSAGSSGTIHFDNGTLTTRSLRAARSELTGTGAINTRGIVSDVDLVFDATHGLSQTFVLADELGQNIAVNLDMTDPLRVGDVGDLGAGYRQASSLTIRDGMSVTCKGYVGVNAGATGEVNVTGPGSKWNVLAPDGSMLAFAVGDYGTGRLNITNGGVVDAQSLVRAYIGANAGSTGAVIVDGPGSAWRLGTATNPALGTSRTALLVGRYGDGSLRITGGASVISDHGGIGGRGGTGDVTVDGAGSSWSNGDYIDIGQYGYGRLTISNGAAVSNKDGNVGYDAQGDVTVTGLNSTWTNTGILTVGLGTLRVKAGGAVTAKSVMQGGMLVMDIGEGSSLTVDGGAGSFANGGVVRLIAGADASPGATYKPILATTWTGAGKYQDIGGKWNSATHEFTVSPTEEYAAGTPFAIDLTQRQRVKVTDGESGQSFAASFLAGKITTPVDFTISPMDAGSLANLDSVLGSGETVLAAWDVVSPGYGPYPVSLSFDIGAGHSTSDLRVWHHDATGWTAFAASDLGYAGHWASFTVTGFSGYAISAVPEPATLSMLLGCALAGLAVWRRSRAAE